MNRFNICFDTKMVRPAVCFMGLALFLAVVTGCGSSNPVGTVKGSVTFNDKPYNNAAVMLINLTTGTASGGNIQDDGTFTIPDPLPVGKYTAYLAPKSQDNVDAATPTQALMDKSLPDKYWNESSSDLVVEVKEGENDVKLEMKK